MTSKEALERIESTFIYNKKRKKDVYSTFMSEFKVIEEYYKDYDLIKQALERLELLETQNESLKHEYDILKFNLEEKIEVIADLQKENQELKEENQELEERLNDAIRVLRKRCEDLDNFDTEIIRLKKENQELKELLNK